MNSGRDNLFAVIEEGSIGSRADGGVPAGEQLEYAPLKDIDDWCMRAE